MVLAGYDLRLPPSFSNHEGASKDYSGRNIGCYRDSSSALTEIPVILPHKRWITSDPSGRGTWTHAWPLLACRISGDKRYVQTSRRKFRHASHIQRLLRVFCKQQVRHETTIVNSLLTIHEYIDPY
jgi:hypothetical protein